MLAGLLCVAEDEGRVGEARAFARVFFVVFIWWVFFGGFFWVGGVDAVLRGTGGGVEYVVGEGVRWCGLRVGEEGFGLWMRGEGWER